jgi:CheY-like chemotaxis protein
MATHRVLVVDDDDDIRESLMDYLRDHGYDALGAADGREALQMLGAANEPPCVIVLDLMMPVMDGWTFREEQLRRPSLSGIPVIVTSAYRQTADPTEQFRKVPHLPKPLNLNALLTLVGQYC